MKSKINQNGKRVNSYYEGYVLYDLDLNEEYFKKSLNEMIHIHDVFHFNLEDLSINERTFEYKSIHALDQLSFKGKLDGIKTPINEPANFQLIYFNNNLRGFYYQLNRLLFDESSIKKFILGLEKEYFIGKYKQTGSSYDSWLSKEGINLNKAMLSGKHQALHKTVSFDENLTKRIRQYADEEGITLIQFFTGVLGIYYKMCQHKDLNFKTNIFDEDLSVIGNLEVKESFGLSRNPELTLKEFLKRDWKSLQKRSPIAIILEDRYSDIKGNHYILPSKEIKEDIEFRIREFDWELELFITFKKYAFKKDEIFFMLNKIRMIVFEVLENSSKKLSEVDLVTKREKELAYQFTDLNPLRPAKSISEYFNQLKDNQLIMENNQNYQVLDLKKKIEKLKKTIRTLKPYQLVSLESDSMIDQLACFIACDQLSLTFSLNKEGNIIKKKMLGYKITHQDAKTYHNISYLSRSLVQKEGYQYYLKNYMTTIGLDTSDVIVTNRFYGHLVPCFLSGAKVVIGNENLIQEHKATYGNIGNDIENYPTLKKAFVKEPIHYKGACQLFIGFESDEAIPYYAMGEVSFGKIQNLQPVEGIGLIMLNKNHNITQVGERGNVYIFGPGVTNTSNALVLPEVDASNIVMTSHSGKLMFDGQLKLY
ncbi:MAG: hypothetical protein JXR88_11935 [Clostridia bacterium]|nr:hypothetical protein [Clostridia bacterium]